MKYDQNCLSSQRNALNSYRWSHHALTQTCNWDETLLPGIAETGDVLAVSLADVLLSWPSRGGPGCQSLCRSGPGGPPLTLPRSRPSYRRRGSGKARAAGGRGRAPGRAPACLSRRPGRRCRAREERGSLLCQAAPPPRPPSRAPAVNGR